MPHIAIIGGASTVFTVGLMADLARTEALYGSTVALMDINEEGLDVVGRVARLMCKETGADCQVETTTDRDDAITDADFVVTTVAVGGDRAWQLDVEIPLKHGVPQTVGDTVGPGGIFRAQRVIPLLLGILDDVEELAPDAWLINFSNPMSVNCYAMGLVSTVPVVGLCHGLHGTVMKIAQTLGIPFEECRALAHGINHFTWIYDLRRNGEDLLDDLDDAVKGHEFNDQPISKRLYEMFGRFPSPGDRHIAEFLPHFLHAQSGNGKKYGQAPHDIRKILKQREDHWQKLRAIADGRRPADELLHASSESAIDLMLARIEDRNELFVANVPNGGCVPNLPADAVVEVPVLVGAHGMRGIQTPPLPEAVAALTNLHVAVHRISTEAALTGDRQLLMQAMTADPLVGDFDIIEPIVDEMLDAFADDLPQYAETDPF